MRAPRLIARRGSIALLLVIQNLALISKMINTINKVTGNSKIRLGVYLLMAFMGLTMLVLSFVQIYVLMTTQEMSAYSSIPAEPNGWPREDQRGAFLILNDNHSASYEGNLIQLLAVTSPGVVSETEGAHLRS